MERDIFKAIADPTRREIIFMLSQQQMTSNTIAERFRSSRQAVSKHIKILSECQLVKQEQIGRETYYSNDYKKLKEVDKWLESIRKNWDKRFNQLDTLFQNTKNKKS